MPLLPQRKAEVVISAINDGFQQIAAAGDIADLPVQEAPIERSIEALGDVAAAFPSPLQADMQRNIDAFNRDPGSNKELFVYVPFFLPFFLSFVISPHGITRV